MMVGQTWIYAGKQVPELYHEPVSVTPHLPPRLSQAPPFKNLELICMSKPTIFAKIHWVGLLLFCLFLRPAPETLADSAVPKDPSIKVEKGADLFDKPGVTKIRIQMPKSSLDGLQKDFTNTTVYVPAQIEGGGQVLEKVGLHLRGVSSFQTIDKKANFTLKFNEFTPEQKFHGLRKIRLSNSANDKTYLMEYLAADLFRAAGVVTPRVNFARVELNGRDLGLYIMIEAVTRDFLKSHFGSDKGNLYEGDETDVDHPLEQDFGKRTRHQNDLNELATVAKEPDLSKRYERLGQLLNLDQFISYVAVEVLIDLWDGYSMRLNNYRVYCDHATGRATFIPHGLDTIFTDAVASLEPEMKGLVTKGLLETPEGHKRYIKRLAELQASIMKKEAIHSRIAKLATAFKPVLNDLKLAKQQERAQTLLEKRIDRRVEFIDKELSALGKAKDRKILKK